MIFKYSSICLKCVQKFRTELMGSSTVMGRIDQPLTGNILTKYRKVEANTVITVSKQLPRRAKGRKYAQLRYNWSKTFQ